MGHDQTKGDLSSVKISVVAPCGCCHYEVTIRDSGIDVRSKGLTEESLRERLAVLSENLPPMLAALAKASPNTRQKSTVQ